MIRNFKKHKLTDKAFTLVELLVVISIIGVLSSVVFASLGNTKIKARDAERKSDLKQIATALELYYADHGTYRISGYGGSGGLGVGWFNYSNGTSYPASIAQGLVDNGLTGSIIIDPSGRTTAPNAYMIYATTVNGEWRYTLWANLENPSADDLATQSSCILSNYDNYSLSYPSANRMNYCIGN